MSNPIFILFVCTCISTSLSLEVSENNGDQSWDIWNNENIRVAENDGFGIQMPSEADPETRSNFRRRSLNSKFDFPNWFS